jgi:hypothetical protein
MEEEEAANEHGECDGSQGKDEIAPSPIVGFGAYST